MPKYKDFEAHITDENWNPLEEFMIEEFEDEKLVTCYIPSVSNQRFCITARCHTKLKGSLSWTSIFHVDGTKIASYGCGPNEIAKLSTVVASEDTGRPLAFANLKLTDNDEEASNTANDLESLGTITVSFVRFRASGEYDSTIKAEGSTLKNQVLHEKNKKAGCHRVSLGDPIPRAVRPTQLGEFLDKAASPQFKIMFRYRSIDILQAQDIAPRPEPAPAPEEDTNPADPSDRGEGSSGGKRSADGDTSHSKPSSKKKRRVKLEDEEVANMRRQLKELQDKLRAAEGDGSDSDDGMKREPSPISVPSFSRRKRIVIDLTSD